MDRGESPGQDGRAALFKLRPVHADHSAIVPAITMLWGAILTALAPVRRWVRSQES